MTKGLRKNAMVRNTYVDIMFVVGVLSIVFVMFYATFNFDSDNTKIEFNGANSFSDGWLVTESETPDDLVGTVYKNTLPEVIDESSTLCFLSTNEKVSVLVNEKPIFSYGYDNNYPGNNDVGSVYHLVNLPVESASKTIEVEFIHDSSYTESVENHDFLLDTEGNIVFQLLKNNFISIFVSVVMALCGISVVINSLVSVRRKESFRAQWYLGVFILSSAIWLATDTLFFQFMFENKFISYFMSNFAFMFMPYSFLMFAREKFPKYRMSITIIAVISWVYFAIRVIFYMWSFISFEKGLYLSHLLIVVCIILTAVICIKERKSTEGQNLLVAMGILSFFVILALMSFYSNDRQHFNPVSNYYRDFFYIGMVMFISILVYDSYKQGIILRKKAMLSEFYKKSAYTDVMTKVGSRTAFREDFDAVNNDLLLHSSVMVIMLDLNNLKQINDFYGHSAGDALLCNLAGCLKESFESVGKVYRIGGDEFVVLVTDKDKSLVENYIDGFWQTANSFGSEQLSAKHIAIGVAIRSSEENAEMNVHELFQLADSRMYEDKKKKKLQNIKEAAQRAAETKTEL